MRFSEAYTPISIEEEENFVQCPTLNHEPHESVVDEDKLFDSDFDNVAYEAGWLVLCPEEAYEKCLSFGSSVYILKEEDLWVVWRGSWINTTAEPTGQKTLARTPNFQQALHCAEKYVQWRLRAKTKNTKGGDLNR